MNKEELWNQIKTLEYDIQISNESGDELGIVSELTKQKERLENKLESLN